MKNRAKCKLCQSVIESFHPSDHVECSCGEIAIWGGTDQYCVSFKNEKNFLRVDDEDNEIVITFQEKEIVKPLDIETKPSRNDLIKMLDEMSNNIENLPSYAKQNPANQYDLQALISLLSLILKS